MKAQLVDPEKKPDVIITVIGSKLVISGDDPKQVQLMCELLSLYTRGDKATERYEVLRLKNVQAEEAAKVINEVFNVTAPAQQGGQGGRGVAAASRPRLNPLALLGLGGGAAAPPTRKAGRVKVVAEKTSNSLIIVKASELDVLTIKDLLEEGHRQRRGGGRRRVQAVDHPAQEYAKASDMVVTIRNVYANYTQRKPPRRSGGPAVQPVPAATAGRTVGRRRSTWTTTSPPTR